MIDIRDKYVAQVVSGKSFAEVGGLWGTVNEKLSVAHEYGATDLTMIDITSFDPDPMHLWVKFRERMAQLGIEDYQCMSQDICKLLELSSSPQFDVVHCAGVLYHHPNPLLLLTALRQVTRCHLILTSAISQQVIQNSSGEYRLPPSAALFVPALSESEFKVQNDYWSQVAAPLAQGLTERSFYSLKDFGPWWWLPTPAAMLAMCETVGFKAISLDLTWNNNALTLLLETVSESPEDRTPQILARSESVQLKLQQIERDVSRVTEDTSPDVADLRAHLQQAQTKIKRLQRKIQETNQIHDMLRQSKDQIAAMESSKFWQIRTQWIKLKNRLGLPE